MLSSSSLSSFGYNDNNCAIPKYKTTNLMLASSTLYVAITRKTYLQLYVESQVEVISFYNKWTYTSRGNSVYDERGLVNGWQVV